MKEETAIQLKQQQIQLARFALSFDQGIDNLIKEAEKLGIRIERNFPEPELREAVKLIAAQPLKSEGEQSEL